MLRRYHYELGIPTSLPDPVIGAALTYSEHAHSAAKSDRVQHCLPPAVPMQFDVVEVEAQGRSVVKWVIRFPISKDKDLVMAVTATYLVKTVWVNDSRDTHATLDRNKYDRPVLVGA